MANINIIVPAYNDYDLLPSALGSVMTQSMREGVHVTIVDDASDTPERAKRIAEDFGDHIDISVIFRDKNGGCGQARQTGIDACRDDYFLFLDCDDVFASPFALEALWKAAQSHRANIVISQFLEEKREAGGGKPVLIPHERDGTWMHGKLYRTEFIRYHDIRFNASRSNEDSAFNSIVFAFAGNVPYVELATYLWRCNPRSLTRREDWLGNTVSVFVGNASYAMRELIRRRADPRYISENAYSYFCSFYGYYETFRHEKREEGFIEAYLDAVRTWYHGTDAGSWLCRVSEVRKAEIYHENGVLRALWERKAMPAGTIFDFEERIRA